MRGNDDIGSLMAAFHVTRQRLDRCTGAQRADGADGLRKMLRAAVRQIVARRAGQNNMAQPQLFCRLRNIFRLVRVRGQRLAAGDVAETAISSANITQNHKRGGVLLVAFTEIRTVCRFADRVQLQIAHQFRDLVHSLLVVADAQPFGFPFHYALPPLLCFENCDRSQRVNGVAFLAQLPTQDTVLRGFDLIDNLIRLDLIQGVALVDLIALVLEPCAQDAALHLGLQFRHNKLLFHIFKRSFSLHQTIQ